MQEMWVRSVGWEDPLEKEMQPTAVFLPGKSHGQRSLVGYSPLGHKETKLREHTCIPHIQTLQWVPISSSQEIRIARNKTQSKLA